MDKVTVNLINDSGTSIACGEKDFTCYTEWDYNIGTIKCGDQVVPSVQSLEFILDVPIGGDASTDLA